jgi:hypothetical protein
MIENTQNNFKFNKLIIDSKFNVLIEDLKKINISLPSMTSGFEQNLNEISFSKDGRIKTLEKDISATNLNPEKGINFIKSKRPILAYDESINRFDSLEGTAFATSHSIVILDTDDYIPANYLTFYFYTKSQEIVNKSRYIKYSEFPEIESKIDYTKDKIKFINERLIDNSILLIDGPLIAGDAYTYFIKPIIEMSERNIIPIFFVKNSFSNIVTNSIEELKNRYNSDLHWAYKFLKNGQRSNFFHYEDAVNPKNSKVFCYTKVFDSSPQRVEFHSETFKKNAYLIPDILDMIYYQLILQGNVNNPQVRLIAIAERYARSTLNLIDINKILKEVGIVPTMNQKRFGW